MYVCGYRLLEGFRERGLQFHFEGSHKVKDGDILGTAFANSDSVISDTDDDDD